MGTLVMSTDMLWHIANHRFIITIIINDACEM